MSKYDPLRDHLKSVMADTIVMTFGEVEAVLGLPLPNSARKHPAWWANEREGHHVHARSWMAAGYLTRDLNLTARKVTFVRHR